MIQKQYNDLDLSKWRDYEEVLTDSLWLFAERDRTGGHKGDYHGNFVPQVPRQLLLRFTRAGDVVLDLFLGSGTTLLECRRLLRSGIGVELQPGVAALARERLQASRDLFGVAEEAAGLFLEIVTGDSKNNQTRKQVENILNQNNKQQVQLVILHPPYHDIIRFSSDPADLSNAATVDSFLEQLRSVWANFSSLLEPGRHLALVIGDKYTQGEWVPLGFYAMHDFLQHFPGLILKSIIVKNITNSRGKRQQEHLWRFRALRGGYYVFRHEYIFLFQKKLDAPGKKKYNEQ